MKNVAIFGAGRIGRIHASNLAALAGVRLKYVSDPVAAAASGLAGQLGAQVATVEQVFADPEVDAVYLSLPNFLHRDFALAAVAAGKPFWIAIKLVGVVAQFAGCLGNQRFGFAHNARDIAESCVEALRLVEFSQRFGEPIMGTLTRAIQQFLG